MADYPDQLQKGRHRDLTGRRGDIWIRRAFLMVFAVIVVCGLLNVFGQRAHSASASGGGAELKVEGPDRVRGGLLYQQQITIHAQRDIEHPRLVLASGWLDGQTINTIEPAAEGETSRDGDLVLSFDSISAGDDFVVYLDYQVNPTHVGKTDHTIELDDAEQPLVRVPGDLLTFP